MEIPDSDRLHVFNTSRTALKGAVQGGKLFITGAASAVLGSLTRVETVTSVVRQGTGGTVITQTGRRFSISTGRGLNEIDLACCACTLTPSLASLFKELLNQRRRSKRLRSYDFAKLPSDILNSIEELIEKGEAENRRIQSRGRRVVRTLTEVLKPKTVKVYVFRTADADQGEYAKGFGNYGLPPLTVQIEVIGKTIYAVTDSEKSFVLGPKSRVTMRGLMQRQRAGALECTIETRILKP